MIFAFKMEEKLTRKRVERFPLKDAEGGKGFCSRIDPLKTKDLFDAEEMEVETIKDSEMPSPA